MAEEVDAWAESTVADEFYVQLGKRLDAAVNRGDLRPCINNRAVRWGHVLASKSVLAPLTSADIRDLRLVNGDVLVCEGGEIGRASVWDDELPEAYFLNTLHRLRSKGRYEPRLLVAFFERWAATGEFSALVGKSSIAHLTKENLLRVRIPLPTRAEQGRMVQALSAVDRLVSRLERLIAKKEAMKQGMMQQLLVGRTRLPGYSEPWSDVRIGDLAAVVSGGTPRSSVAEYWNGGIAWCTPTDITGEGSRYLTCTERTISQAGLDSSAARLLPTGSLLLCTRATIGEVKIAAKPVATNQGFKSLVPRPGVPSEFLYYKLLTLKEELTSRGSGSTFLEISKKDVVSLRLMMPKKAEQQAIASVLGDADDELTELRGRLSKAENIKQGMMQQLLTGRTRLLVVEAPA